MRIILLSLMLVLATLLTGCLQSNDRDEDAEGGGAWEGTSVFGVELEPITLHERIEPGQPQTWAIQAVNIGPPDGNPVEYDAACRGPFEVALVGPDGNTHHADEPQMDCMEVDERVLQGGETVDFDWSWDGRTWSEGAGKQDAAPGTYTLRFTFEGYHDGNPEHLTDPTGETKVQVG